jgi:hypothetical protein
MTAIREFIGDGLKWAQPSAFTMRFELRKALELAGTLVFRSAFGSLATAEGADGCWTFKRVGFLQTRVSIRSCGDDHDLATFKNQTWSGGGTLELASGKKLLANTNFWSTSLQFTTETGDALVSFNTGGVFHLGAAVVVNPQAADMNELPLIVMLGWYLIVMMHSDQTASAAIIG